MFDFVYRKKANLWTHTYCFTASQVEIKERAMRAGLSSWSMRHYRRCQKKQTKVRVKRLPKDFIDGVLARNADSVEINQSKLVKSTARKSFPNSNRVVMKREDDKVIDELLEDSSDEAEHEAKVPVEPNNIKQYASGFATWTDKHDTDPVVEIDLDQGQIKEEGGTGSNQVAAKSISVPRPLPELQKIYINNTVKKSQNKDIECVDLCSSDEDS